MKKKSLKGKYIIAFDTICDGWQCATYEKDIPVLFNSRNEAIIEMFDDALSMLENRSAKELKEYNEGVTPKIVKQMRKIFDSGDVQKMEEFLNLNPNTNDNNEFIVPAEEFVLGHKTIFTGK